VSITSLTQLFAAPGRSTLSIVAHIPICMLVLLLAPLWIATALRPETLLPAARELLHELRGWSCTVTSNCRK
jgi:hypothetical protein